MAELVVPQLSVRKNSIGDGLRQRRINFIEGPDISISVTEDTTNNEINVKISIGAGSGGDESWKPTYHTSGVNAGEIDFIEIFSGAIQTTPNRRFRCDITYDAGRDPTIQTWKTYDPADGITVLSTKTLTNTWVNGDLTKVVEATA